MKPTVYLAGMINTEFPETLSWRLRAAEALEESFRVLDPLRGMNGLCCSSNDTGITTDSASNASVLLRDYNDLRQSNVMLANLNTYGSARPMVGTLVELGWAWQLKIPVVAICDMNHENDFRSHAYLMRRHPFIQQFVAQYFANEVDAVEFVKAWYA